MNNSRPRLAAFSGAIALAVAGALALAIPASAHNYYTSSTPEMNAVLTTLPEEFVVTTNDKLLELGDAAGGFFMQVRGPDNLYYGDGCVTVSGSSVSMVAAVGPAGDYSLDWQVVSTDGHTVAGQIPFSWSPGPEAESPSRGFTAPAVCGEAPEPTVTERPEDAATETPSPTDSAAVDTPADAEEDSGTVVLWIAGGIGAVAAIVIAAVVLIRPKKKI